MAVTVREITRRNMEKYRELILPSVYEELSGVKTLCEEYFCLGLDNGSSPASALIADMEDNGDLNLLSVYTDLPMRRSGYGKRLFDSLCRLAASLYEWDRGQRGDIITIKTTYCLFDEFRIPFEEWLRSVGFDRFYVIDGEEYDSDTKVRAATAQLYIFSTRELDNDYKH